MDRRIRVFILDDDPVFREVLFSQLSQRGLECYAAGRWIDVEAWVVDCGPPEVLVLDYYLDDGDLTGLELCDKIRDTLTPATWTN